jgi:glycosyltransferase involved in cell wall biosynthesis
MGRPRNGIDRPWPVWRDRLPAAAGPRAEGGLRLQRGSTRPHSATEPLVSYVTVVKNGAGTLERTLLSVRQQTWSAIEHIVLDGSSTDGTVGIIERHAASLEYYASESDAGLYDALNKAVELAAGELICVLNADDWLTPDAAAVAVAAGPAEPGIGSDLRQRVPQRRLCHARSVRGLGPVPQQPANRCRLRLAGRLPARRRGLRLR